MDITSGLDRVEELYLSGEPREALGELSDIVSRFAQAPADARQSALFALVARVGHEDPRLGAHFALAAGALIESGLDARPLAHAIIEPVSRALETAVRFVERAKAMPHAGDEAEGLAVGDKVLSHESVNAIARDDFEAVTSFLSLDHWYRPAVAAWSRDRPSLKKAQANPSFATSLEALVGTSEGAHWLSLLWNVLLDAPFVIVFPELGEAWALTMSGASDMGQLTVLLAEALADPLGRVGITERPSELMTSVMRGAGPQQVEGNTYGAALHFYSWRALDPKTNLPEDGKFQWRAPGGTGSHSLPPDFLPAGVEPFDDGTRVLYCVGPKAPGSRFVRVLPAVRIFEALPASVTDVRRLSAEEAERWSTTVRTQLGAT